MTKWKRNKLIKAEKIAARAAVKENKGNNYIENVFKKIKNGFKKIINRFRK